MQEGVYQKPVRTTDELKQHLIAAWSGIQQSVIDAVLSQCSNNVVDDDYDAKTLFCDQFWAAWCRVQQTAPYKW